MRADETPAAIDAEAASAETHDSHGYVGYVVVAVILSAITIVEIAIPSVEAINAALTRAGTVAVLLALSFVKGAGVVMYYMHLRHDNRLFAALFLFPFVIASTIVIVLFLFFTLVGF